MRIKQLILIAAVAIMAASCAHSFEAEQTQKAPIGFGTWAEMLTKTEHRTAGSNTFLSGDTFNVYGYNTIESTNHNIFNGEVVTAKDANEQEAGEAVAKWVYSPLRFWDPTASSYTFFAASPSGILYSSPVDQNNGGAYSGLFVSSSRTFTGQDNDVLVATKKVVGASQNGPKYSSNPILLEFNHVASLVDVKVKKDAALPDEATLRITSASLMGIENQGAFTVTSYDNNNKPVVTWSSSNTNTYASTVTPLDVTINTTYNNEGAANGTSDGQNAVTVPDGVQALFSNYVLKPQDLSSGSQILHLEYKIVTREDDQQTNENEEVSTSYVAEIALKDFVQTDNKNNTGNAATSSWAQGTHYIYTVTIGANAITFTAQINNWTTTVNGYHYILQ